MPKQDRQRWEVPKPNEWEVVGTTGKGPIIEANRFPRHDEEVRAVSGIDAAFNEPIKPIDWELLYKRDVVLPDYFGKKIYKPLERETTGLDGPYYDLPKGSEQLQDLIMHKDMNFQVGNIFKAAYRMNDKNTPKYNLEKILFYVRYELERIADAED